MPDVNAVQTERLDLRPVQAGDLPELFVITSDARTWEHEPDRRHVDPKTTRAWIDRAARRWRRDGLSYWLVRLRATGEVIGVGGVQRRADRSWNLFYRLAPEAWGHGYATEMSRAAIDAAHATDPGAPVLAWILEHNTASRRVAERLDLIDHGPRLDRSDGVVRRVYADRVLPPPSPGAS